MKDQQAAFQTASRQEEQLWIQRGIDSPLMLGGPFARRPARCQPTRDTDVFVCRTITKEYRSSPWKAEDQRFRRHGHDWAYDLGRYEEVEGPYRLAAAAGASSTRLCYDKRTHCLDRVPGVVFAWGANAAYVVAAHHPLIPGTGEIDKGHTDYFYIDRAKDNGRDVPSRAVQGPLSPETYKVEALRLKLPAFDGYYPDLK